MKKPVLLAMPGNEEFAARLALHLDADVAALTVRRFPDSESYVRIVDDVAQRNVAIVCSLREPDPQILSLIFAAREAVELGAAKVGLIAPYLAYLRQDKRFNSGEALSSAYFAELLSRYFTWLVTVDPHLHRWHSLTELYSLQSAVVHAAGDVGAWIRDNVARPKLIGPDAESRQWVSAVAQVAGAEFIVVEKTRRGDREVSVHLPDVSDWADVTPVLVDDIASSAHTLISVLNQWPPGLAQRPLCVAVHGVFADGAYRELLAAKPARVVTTNTIAHESNAIDVTARVAAAIRPLISAPHQSIRVPDRSGPEVT